MASKFLCWCWGSFGFWSANLQILYVSLYSRTMESVTQRIVLELLDVEERYFLKNCRRQLISKMAAFFLDTEFQLAAGQRWALRSQTSSWNAESIKMDVGPQTSNWFLKLWQITAEEENPTKLRQCDSTGWSLLNFLLRLNNLCSMTRVTLLLLRSHRTSHVFSVTGEAELLFEVKTVWVGKFPPDKILLHNLHN